MRPDDSIDDLDTRIELAEARLIARQDRLRHQVLQLGEDMRETLRPERVLAPAAAGVGTLLSLWWLVRRRRPAQAALGWRGAGLPMLRASAAHATHWPWMRIFGLVAPLLPMLRKRLAGAMAGPHADVYDPVDDAARALAVVQQIEPARWAGRWVELAATPARQASQTPAAVDLHYLLRRDGQYEVVRRSIDLNRRQRTTRGLARPLPGGGGARMQISLWPTWLRALPLAWDDHWVLHVEDDYAAAWVGQRGGRQLSLLARDLDLPEERVQALLRLAQERGYAVDRLRFHGTVPLNTIPG